jgi:uncharacterized membrane protein YwzB
MLQKTKEFIVETLKRHFDVKTIILILTILFSAFGTYKVQAFRSDQFFDLATETAARVDSNTVAIKLVRQQSNMKDHAQAEAIGEIKEGLNVISEDIKQILQRLPQ